MMRLKAKSRRLSSSEFHNNKTLTTIKSMTHLTESFLAKVTFERKLSDVAYTLVQVNLQKSTFRNRTSNDFYS